MYSWTLIHIRRTDNIRPNHTTDQNTVCSACGTLLYENWLCHTGFISIVVCTCLDLSRLIEREQHMCRIIVNIWFKCIVGVEEDL